ncbi:hypothetical protein SAMN06265346_103280 [Flavobacterium hercynium]|uniref:Uncharacterized protein n=1 Tax=Flavobacterium hercynium TaxID=387094 RepID=A0A226GQA6_9FLAO|nr:hypothetical protein B0A66_22250 [Flavobacterium hercynium]SMP12849.1 hypothetical protein SAMN06265346_103280 [Flavobacterium hercynium]
MTIKILYSAFILFLNFSIYKGIQKRSINTKQLFALAIFAMTILILNFKFEALSNKLILFLVPFSFSIFVLDFFKNTIDVYEKSDLLVKQKIERFKFLMINIMLPILITIYQLLMIWSEKLFSQMIK